MLSPIQGFTYNKFEKSTDWPNLKKTFDYCFDGNKLIGGNENLYLSGPVTYQKVGNTTIVDGVASGFSGSNYISVPGWNTSTPWEFGVKCKATDASAAILGPVNNSNGLIIRFDSSSRVLAFLSSSNAFADIARAFSIPAVLNADYWLRCKFTGMQYIFSYSTDGITYTDTTPIVSSVSINPFQTLHIGHCPYISGYMKGSIDFNNTYIKVNDRLWFYGKNYTTKNMVPVAAGLEYNNTTTSSIGWVSTNTDRVKGPVTYTKVGNPKIVNGVVSGFSGSNYLETSSNWASYDNFEMSCTFTTPNDMSNMDNICSIMTTGLGRNGLDLYKDSSNNWFLHFNYNLENSQVGGLWVTNYPLQANHTYLGKLLYNGSVYTIQLYENNNLLGQNTLSSSNKPIVPTPYPKIYFGFSFYQTKVFTGSIDLNETYIKVNSQAWFGNCPSEFQQFTPAPKGIMIGKDETEMLKVETYQDKGVVDYTIVGSPIIQDGIASGFTNDSYLQINSTFDITQDFEAVFKLKTPSSLISGSAERIFGYYAGGVNGVYIRNVNNNNIIYYWAYGSTGSTQINNGNYGLEFNKDILIRIRHTQGKYYLDHSVDNGTTWRDTANFEGTYTGTLPTACYIGSFYNNPYSNIIDLNGSYIKINGQYWFHPYSNSYPKLVGPVSYTTAGSPTIVNGVASGFSGSNYLQLNNTAVNSINSFKVAIRFTTPATSWSESVPLLSYLSQPSGLSNLYSFFALSNYGPVVAYIFKKSNNTQQSYVTNTLIDLRNRFNETFTAVLTTDMSNVSFDLYDANNNLLVQNSYSSQDLVGQIQPNMLLGINTSKDNWFTGSIDLNNTYIKVNGALWFGKEDWNPAIYDDKSIYLLSAHTSDYSSYNQLGINAEVSNSGSYNIWVDNQKIVDSSSSNMNINWSNLDLTTGYSITTPTALKAHVIKIEPSNSENNITSFSADIEDSDEISEGILQSIINTNSSISLNNAFTSEVISNPLLKSIEGKIKLSDENSLISFAGNNSSIEHIDTITYSGSNGASLSNSLNGLDKLKYIRLDGNFNTNSINKFSGNSSLEKLDLTDTMETAKKCFKNTNLKQLPKVTFNSSDLTDVITHDTNLLPTSIDLSGNTSLEKIDIYGSSSKPITGLKSLIVSNEAPFTGNSPQINISYTGLDKTALIDLFNSLPNVSNGQVINIVGCVGTLDLSDSDKAIATNKGWTLQDS